MSIGTCSERGLVPGFGGIVVLAVTGLVQARADTDLTVRRSSITGMASFVTAADHGPIGLNLPREIGETNVQVFLREHGALFGIVDVEMQLALDKVEIDTLGFTHTKHRQVHEGIPVFAGTMIVHQRPDGAVHAANGDFYPIPGKLSTTPDIDAPHAERIGRALVAHPRLEVELSQLVIVDPGWYGSPATGPHLAWHVILAAPLDAIRESLFVDAHTGEVLDRWSMIHTIKQREIYDGGELGVIPGTLARGEGDAAVGDADIDAAYDWYGDTYDYFFRAFGRDSIDDNGMTMIATVHSTAPSCPNAFWNGAQMVFCTNTVTDDVVGHELAHGVTQHTARLIYRNQAGMLNESFSDVFGEMIDLFNGDVAWAGAPGGTPWPVHPTGPGGDLPNNGRSVCTPAPLYVDGKRWLIAEDAAAFGGAIRDMWEPPCRNDPDDGNSPLQVCSGFDNGGVHTGSGVPNHAFAILTDGKSFNGYDVAAIGPIKTGAVWYRALSVYLTAASDFRDAYDAFNQAALDLVGSFPPDPRTGFLSTDMFTVADAAEVDKALQAVEMNSDGACGDTDNVLLAEAPTFCDDVQVVFFDAFESGPNGWTVSNSAPPTPYDWEQVSGNLPFDHAGTVWFVADLYSDCDGSDESGVHSLASPAFLLPEASGVYLVSFAHYLLTEGAWDGGNVKIDVNGGGFQTIPRAAFEHNPYNGVMRTAVNSGNTNPMEGETAWTGGGGGWGASVINLSGIATGGDSITLRYDLGKDLCNGYDGWYLDDFMILRCPDADNDDVSDYRDTVNIDASEPVYGIGAELATETVFNLRRRAMSDVSMQFLAHADLSRSDEYVDVSLNGNFVGRVYENSAVDCSFWPNRAELVVAKDDFNAWSPTTTLQVALVGSFQVAAQLCSNDNYVMVVMTYERAGAGDINADGAVNVPDLLATLTEWGPCLDCFEDINGDGVVNVPDLLVILTNWGN